VASSADSVRHAPGDPVAAHDVEHHVEIEVLVRFGLSAWCYPNSTRRWLVGHDSRPGSQITGSETTTLGCLELRALGEARH
jgi:hypothetical protein